MQDTIAIIMVFSVPIIAIISGTFYKLKHRQMELDSLHKRDEQFYRRLEELQLENEQNQRRIQNLEQIVLDQDRSLKMKIDQEIQLQNKL